MAEIRFIQGKRIFLRPVIREDVPIFLRWINDPDVRRLLGSYLPMMEAGEEEWVEKLSKDREKRVILAIILNNGNLIGTVGLHNLSARDRKAETGTMIGEKEFWGKGYATEAKMLILRYAFMTLNLRKIGSKILAPNTASLRVQEKCGYKIEGLLKKEAFVDGEYVDVVLLAVFKKEWLPVWEEYEKTHLK